MTSPPIRSGKISAASLITQGGGIFERLKGKCPAEARGVARPIDNIS
ncbi:MAG TPA: hypothetical protein VFU28_25250 [Vicinamibacterales bacterium]|nr:hypothetical protein [Vicinamibacterales bacterium]